MTYKDDLQYIVNTIESEKQICRNELKTLPKGTLHIVHNGKYLQYRKILGKGQSTRRETIGKDRRTIDDLARKEFLLTKIRQLDSDKHIIGDTIAKISDGSVDYVIKEMKHGVNLLPAERFVKNTGSGLLIPCPSADTVLKIWNAATMLDGIDPEEWAVAPYRANTSYLENKIHTGSFGIAYRSKSELSIGDSIIRRSLPMHYDQLICIAGAFVSPDFIIADKHGNIIIWEHWGFDSEGYLQKNLEKLRLYFSAGFRPGKNLIITCDDPDGSLNMIRIGRIIDAYCM